MNAGKWSISAVAVFLTLVVASHVVAQDWPQWRGPGRDGNVADFKVPETWPTELKQQWKITVGAGDSSPVVVGDKVYVFARQDDNEVTLCLGAADGKEVWRNSNPVKAISGPSARAHAGPRSTPAVADGKVVTLGVTGILSCLNTTDGKVVWRKDDISGTPRFYTATSPVVVDGMVIIQLGSESDGATVAYDLATGEQKWKASGQGAAYASPVVATAGGVKQIVTLTSQNVVADAAADGKSLWQVSFAPQRRAYNAATPIVSGDTVIVSGQGRGTKALKLTKGEGGWTTSELWSNSLAVQFCTPVLQDGFVYAISDKGTLFCLSAATGETVWSDEARLGAYGAMLAAGPVIMALNDKGHMLVFKAGTKQYEQLADLKVADGATFACPAVVGKRIFVKGPDSLILWTLE